MKKLTLLLIFQSLYLFSFSTTPYITSGEKLIDTKIEKVTVFLSSAQIFRKGNVTLKKGENLIKLNGLSPFLDVESINVSLEGNATILSVNHTLNYLANQKWSERVDSLNKQIDFIHDSIDVFQAALFAQEQKEKLLHQNQDMRTGSSGVDLEKLMHALELFEKQFEEIQKSKNELTQKIFLLERRKTMTNTEMNKKNLVKNLPDGEVRIKLKSDLAQTIPLNISYITSEAGWYPKYDIRAIDVSSPLIVQYKALIYQRTREDWTDVMLTFSSATPNKKSTVPVLGSWKLNYKRYTNIQRNQIRNSTNNSGDISGQILDEAGEPLIGANVVIKGSSIGTVTDLDGNFNLVNTGQVQTLVVSYTGLETKEINSNNLYQPVVLNTGLILDEVVVTGYLSGSVRGITTSNSNTNVSRDKINNTVRGNFQEGQTSFSIEVDIPYTLLSDGEPFNIPLEEFEIDAKYHFEIVPKIDPQAFLIATIYEYNQYHILDGEALLFFEKTYVGKTYLLAESFSDSTSISLGRDNGIAVSREISKEFNKRQFLGNKKIDTRGISINIRNNKNESVDVKVMDQIPVSVNNQIEVDAENLTGGQLNESSGQLTWSFNLLPNSEKKINILYTVKYPKSEQLLLE